MAENIWGGVAPGTWSTTTNWSLGTVPVDGEEVKFPPENSQSVLGSNQTNVKLGLLHIHEGSLVNIASLGSRLQIDADLVYHQGTGSLYLKSSYDESGEPAEYTDHVVIDSPNMNNAAYLDGERIERITCLRGKTELAPTLGSVSVPAVLEVGTEDGRSSHGTIVVINENDSDSTAIMVTTAHIQSGTVKSTGRIGTVYQSGGLYYQGTEQCDTLYLKGGLCVYNAGTTLGTITTAYVYPGAVLDLGQNNIAKTITTIYRYRGSTVIMDPRLVTIGTDNDFGGRYIGPATREALALRAAAA